MINHARLPEKNIMESPNSTGDYAPSKLEWASLLIAFVLTVLVLTPFGPEMPIAGVDGSWAYAMNVATAEQMKFGKDIVFTFGPLASVYTGVYHPATDALMVGGSLLISVAMFAGLFAGVVPQRRGLLLLFPILVGLAWLPQWDGWRDAVFMLLPLLLPFAVIRGIETKQQPKAAIVLLAAAIGILPLVKGNFGLIAALASLVAVILCWRTAWKVAITIVAVEIGALVVAWCIAGQALEDLPVYFIAQIPLVSGYTDGMSTSPDDRTADLIVFLVTGGVLVAVSALGGLRSRWYAPVIAALYLFVTFKSGFVRHDAPHAFIAASALVLMGFLLYVMPGSQHGRGAVAFASGLVGWSLIACSILPVDPASSLARVGEAIRIPAHGIWQRMTDASALEREYLRRRAVLSDRPPFYGASGTADVYPWDLSPLLASNITWKPRPVLQSYAAFTPSLIATNASHLKTNPPPRVYFNINPVDQRYPTTEDGASWLDLLGSYRAKALDGGYVELQHQAQTPALQPGGAVDKDASLGETVVVPGADRPVWVTLDIKPTLLGRLYAILYKAPELTLEATYGDGSTAAYRIIAGMSKTGFLLSPTVSDANQFVALWSHARDQLLHDRQVVAFGIRGQRGTRWMWKQDYAVTFAPLDIPQTQEADAVLTGHWKEGAAASSYPVGGICNIEDVDGVAVTAASMELADRIVQIRGWAAMDGHKGQPNKGMSLHAEGQDGRSYVLPVHRVSRPDVSNYFGQPGIEYSGFHAFVDVRNLPQAVDIRVLQEDAGRTVICQPARLTVHRMHASR